MACNFKWDGNFAPRLGATYDIKGDGRSKLFVSFGRFYTKIPNDLAARAMSADAATTRADYFDANLTQPVPDGLNVAGVTVHYLPPAGAGAAFINPDSKSSYQQEFLGGAEFAVGRNGSVGLRYIHRSVPRILEDYSAAPVAAYDIGCPGLAGVQYFIDNISPALPHFDCSSLGADGQLISQAGFEDPVHKYDSVEFTVNKSFSDNWSLMASYRWSKLSGLYEGAFRNDNGQSDPSITSLFDFPTNDPSYAAIGVPNFGYRGDIRYQGCTLGCGVLPNDRTHQVKTYASYAFSNLNAGIGVQAGTGVPLTNLAANPNYGNAGEIPLTQKGGGITTIDDGTLKRAPMDLTVDAHLDYTIKVGKSQRMVLAADAFNLLNRQSLDLVRLLQRQGLRRDEPELWRRRQRMPQPEHLVSRPALAPTGRSVRVVVISDPLVERPRGAGEIPPPFSLPPRRLHRLGSTRSVPRPFTSKSCIVIRRLEVVFNPLNHIHLFERLNSGATAPDSPS